MIEHKFQVRDHINSVGNPNAGIIPDAWSEAHPGFKVLATNDAGYTLEDLLPTGFGVRDFTFGFEKDYEVVA